MYLCKSKLFIHNTTIYMYSYCIPRIAKIKPLSNDAPSALVSIFIILDISLI